MDKRCVMRLAMAPGTSPLFADMLRIVLPPNLVAAIGRNAVPVRLVLDLSSAPAPEYLPLLVLLQRLCGTPTPPSFLQLSKEQLFDVIQAAKGLAVFARHENPDQGQAWEQGWLQGQSLSAAAPAEAGHTTLQEKDRVSALRAAHARLKPAAALSPVLVDGSEHFLSLQLPPREHPGYGELLELIKASGFALEPSNRRWWLRDRHKVLNFLAEHGDMLREKFSAVFTENFKKNTGKLENAELVCSVEEARGGFSLTMALRAGSSDVERLRLAMASEQSYVEDRGRVYLISREKRQKIAEVQRALAGEQQASFSPLRSLRIQAAQVPEAQELLESLSPNFQAPATWRLRSDSLRQVSSLREAPLPAPFQQQLRSYQRLGVAWLWFLRKQELGGILADEMGLGKTLQAIGLLLAAAGEKQGGRANLVVAPASLLENWRRELARFAPSLRVFVHHGEQRLSGVDAFSAHDLVITSYGTLVRDRDLFSSGEFSVLVADEAQHIKNRRSLNAQALRQLPAKARFLLTGTPLENSLDDLRSLFDFLMPGYLTPAPAGLRGEEKSWYDERLLARTAPYILRRTKSAVAKELPPKIENVTWCEMSPEQSSLYRQMQESSERELLDLETGGASEARLRFAMLTQLLRLRQICCDPRLVAKGTAPGKVAPSAKLALLRELLDEAIDDGHRVLVFSQFSSMLGLIREELQEAGLESCYLDGSMNAKARQAEVDRFQGSAQVPVFLLSLKAGGVGLNLTGADTVVHFDPWWNPAAEAQASDRAHRIGQTRTVTSYKLICSGTVEEKVLALQSEKRALLADVFEASDAAAARLSLSDLRSLLG